MNIPAETTISRYAISARNLLMRCEASFPGSDSEGKVCSGSFASV